MYFLYTQFGETGQGNDAQSILGLSGVTAERGPTIFQPCYHPGW